MKSLDELRHWLRLAGLPEPEIAPPDFDPASVTEREYVAMRYCDGKRPEMIVEFYDHLEKWNTLEWRRCHHDDLHPDMSYAARQAGILSWGLLAIRLYRWEYREAAV